MHSIPTNAILYNISTAGMLCNQMQQTCCRHSVVRQIKEVPYTLHTTAAASLHTTAAASNYCSCCDSAGILEDTCALCISSISFPGPSEQAGRPPRARARHGFHQAGEVGCGEYGAELSRKEAPWTPTKSCLEACVWLYLNSLYDRNTSIARSTREGTWTPRHP